MFMPALESLGGEELKAKWMEKAVNHEILGTYAQTELGHGRFHQLNANSTCGDLEPGLSHQGVDQFEAL